MPLNRRRFLGSLLRAGAIAVVAPQLLVPDDPEFAAWVPKRYFSGYSVSELGRPTGGTLGGGTYYLSFAERSTPIVRPDLLAFDRVGDWNAKLILWLQT